MKFEALYGKVLAFVLIGIVLGVGLLVLNNFMSQTSVSGTTAETALNDTINALAGFPDWFPIIVTVIAAAIILGLVLSALGGDRRGF